MKKKSAFLIMPLCVAWIVPVVGLHAESDTPAEKPRVSEALDSVDVAKILLREGNPERAIALLEERLFESEEPMSRFLLLRKLGYVHLLSGTYGKAHQRLSEALAIQPDDMQIRFSLSAMFLRKQEASAAFNMLAPVENAALNSSQEVFLVSFQRACAHALSGNTDQAIRFLEQAARADPGFTLRSLDAPPLESIRDRPAFQAFREALKKKGSSEQGSD